MNDHCYTLANGLTGITASTMGYMATLMQDLDTCARLAASSVGIVVGLLTAINLIRNLKR
jgi:hypothetical protein